MESTKSNTDLPREDIQYVGVAGITRYCIDSIQRYLQYGDALAQVKIVTCANHHAFIISTSEEQDFIVVRGGFASGYPGEGPSGFAYALSLFEAFKADVQEFEVSNKFFNRLNQSLLTSSDLSNLGSQRPVRPSRISDYTHPFDKLDKGIDWNGFPLSMPYRVIDSRIMNLATDFWTDPSERILTGYKRFEDTLREKCQSVEHGRKLFARAFRDNDSILYWKELQHNEQATRANFIIESYSCFRNPRAHREINTGPENLLSEFLVLNQLFRFEKEATRRPSVEESD